MTRPMRIVMIEDDAFEVQRFSNYFDALNDMELVCSANGEGDGLKAIQNNTPDAIILDLELSEGNGIQLLPKLKKMNLDIQPYIIVTTWTTDQTTLRNIKANGVGFVQPKSMPGYTEHGPEMVANFLREMRPFLTKKATAGESIKVVELTDEERMRAKIVYYLGRIGIVPGTQSQVYLVDAIQIAARQKSLVLDMENVVYPELIRLHHKTMKNLERSMRGRIEAAWDNTDLETLSVEYTQYVSHQKGKPVLKEFIAYYANKIR